MAIDPERRAKLSALINDLASKRVQAIKDAVREAIGHGYNDIQQHAWGLCDCGEGSGCPDWVETGFTLAEGLADGSQPLPGASEAQRKPQDRLGSALDETATQMSGILQNLVEEGGGRSKPGEGEGDGKLGEVLDETALEMTGLLRGVVLDEQEIKSSKQAEEGGVFTDEEPEEK